MLRGVQEHYDLVPQQLVRVPPDREIYTSKVYYVYNEYISKNNLHRFTDSKAKNKVVRAYARPDSERCVVRLLDTYLKLLPPNCSHLYMRPRDNFSPDKPSYLMQRVGINQIKKFMTDIMSIAGFSGYTNHCLRATAVSRMYNAGIPESLISEKSGHRSLDGLRVYEHPSDDLERTAEDSIAGCSKNVEERDGDKEEEKFKPPQSAPPQLPQLPNFSGMNQCTINFNINYPQ